jgi:hypothetical protein
MGLFVGFDKFKETESSLSHFKCDETHNFVKAFFRSFEGVFKETVFGKGRVHREE